MSNRVRIKALINNEYTETAARHIKKGDMPSSYSTDGQFIFKVISRKEYSEMLESLDGVRMPEIDIEATLDTKFVDEED